MIASMSLVRVKDARASPSVSGPGPSTHVHSVAKITDIVTVMKLTEINLLGLRAGSRNAAEKEGEQQKAHDSSKAEILLCQNVSICIAVPECGQILSMVHKWRGIYDRAVWVCSK